MLWYVFVCLTVSGLEELNKSTGIVEETITRGLTAGQSSKRPLFYP